MSTDIIYHYIYRITNTKERKYYYGCRTCKNVHPNKDLGFKYFSSFTENWFEKDQKKNSKDYKYKIIKIFKDRKRALELEIKLHAKFDVGRNSNFYNKSKQTSIGWDTTGKATYRNKNGNTKLLNVNDPRIKSGEYTNINKGRKLTKEHKDKLSSTRTSAYEDDNGKIELLSIDDPRIKLGKYTHINKGKSVYKNKNGDTRRLLINDPRIKSGEYVCINSGSRWMNNGIKNIMCSRYKIDEHIKNGWNFGQLKKKNKKEI